MAADHTLPAAAPPGARVWPVRRLALLLLIWACAATPDAGGAGLDPVGGAQAAANEAGCSELARTQAALSVVDRSLVGGPASYVPDATLAERELALLGSQRLRRDAAWQVVGRVLAPIELPRALLGASARASLPAWQTWHAKDDLTRLFRHLYPELTPDEQLARTRFSAGALDAAELWNDTAINDFPDWTFERLLEYQTAIDQASELAGLGEIHRVAYGPAASRHLLTSYPEILACRELPSSDTTTLAPASEPPSSSCPSQRAKPACLAGQFPEAAIAIKADWRRAGIDTLLPVFDTSAGALQRRLSVDGKFAWGAADGEADPGPDDIYTLQLPNGNVFRLAGLHIMTKELEHWFWISLWWSPEPDQDFGADRPNALPPPWQNYKLCSVTAFDERDPDPTGGYGVEHPSLAEALLATYEGEGGPSWCSNPYLEVGEGNAATNCIGCHQHAGTGLGSEDILSAARGLPEHGRTALRDSFPTDYVFAPTAGDDLGAMFEETEAHYVP